jgi:pyruvate,water dikinase
LKKGKYIYQLRKGLNNKEIGNKAQSLLFLHRNGFSIPETFVIVSKVFDVYLQENRTVPANLQSEIIKLPDYSYAIRSSTSLEDSGIHSYAGQFLTLTGVRGSDNILSAVEEVWGSAISHLESGYHLRAAGSLNKIKCAVILQKMISPLISGVSFSTNPVTNLNETIIEAVEGKGEELVQKGATPLRWRFKGDKVIEGKEDYPEMQVIKRIASDTLRLKKLYRQDADVEWVYDGGKIYYLQIRSVQKT